MPHHALQCRSFPFTPKCWHAAHEDQNVPATGSEKPLEGPPEANQGLAKLNTQVEARLQRTEVSTEILTGGRLRQYWSTLDQPKRDRLQPFLDRMSLALRRLDVYQEVPKLEKDKAEVYDAVKQYEWAARGFNQESGVARFFPENLTEHDWKKPAHARPEERTVAFARAREIASALQINYSTNPNLDPVTTEGPDAKPGERPEPVELDIEALRQLKNVPLAQLDHFILKEWPQGRKRLKLNIAECRQLTSELAPVDRDIIREKAGEDRKASLARLRAIIIEHAWNTYVNPLAYAPGAKFDLRLAPNFGLAILNQPPRTEKFAFVPREGVAADQAEIDSAEECRLLLDDNWKEVLSMYGEREGLKAWKGNPDAIRAVREFRREESDVRNSPEARALGRLPFSQAIMASPMGPILWLVLYFSLDKDGKKALAAGTGMAYLAERAGGKDGLAAIYNNLGDKVPWAKKWMDDMTGGLWGLKAQEYTRTTFERFSGLEGVQSETRDWMLRDSDGLSASKKVGIYLILNDQPVRDIRAAVGKAPNAADGIGKYIKQWNIGSHGEWWKTGGTTPEKIKELAKKLGSEGINLAGQGERAFEQFLGQILAGITETDIRQRFFAPTITDPNKRDTLKANPMHGVLEDAAYQDEEFETALKRKYPERGAVPSPAPAPAAGAGTPTGTPPAAPTGAPPAGPAAALTQPPAAGTSAAFFAGTVSERASATYDDKEADWYNATFEHDGKSYKAFRKRSEPGEGFWVEAKDATGNPDPATYSLCFPTANSFAMFERTLEINKLPDGKVTLRALFNEGLAKIPAQCWTLDRFEFPQDANISAKDGFFNVYITTTAVAPSNKLKLYAQAGESTFHVEDATGTAIENVSRSTASGTSYEFSNGAELDAALRLSTITKPLAVPVTPSVAPEVKPEDVVIQDSGGKKLEAFSTTDSMPAIAQTIWSKTLGKLNIGKADVVDYKASSSANSKFTIQGREIVLGIMNKGAGSFSFDAYFFAGGKRVTIYSKEHRIDPIRRPADQDTVAAELVAEIRDEIEYDPQKAMKYETTLGGTKVFTIGKGSDGLEVWIRKQGKTWQISYNISTVWHDLQPTIFSTPLVRSNTAERLMDYLIKHPNIDPPTVP